TLAAGRRPWKGEGDAEYVPRELRIDLRKLRGDDFAQQPERGGRGRFGLRHLRRAVEGKAGVIQYLLDRVAGVHARQREAAVGEREETAVGDQPDRPAGPEHVLLIGARRADEVDLRHQRAARMLGAEQNDFRHDVIEIGRTERPGETHLRVL